MPRFQVRTNCEYILEIEVDTAEEALEKASKTDYADWDKAWAPYEVENTDEEEEKTT